MAPTHPTQFYNALLAANIPFAGLSFDGIDLFGDVTSINAAKAAFHSHGQIDNLKSNIRHWQEEVGKLHSQINQLKRQLVK